MHQLEGPIESKWNPDTIQSSLLPHYLTVYFQEFGLGLGLGFHIVLFPGLFGFWTSHISQPLSITAYPALIWCVYINLEIARIEVVNKSFE